MVNSLIAKLVIALSLFASPAMTADGDPIYEGWRCTGEQKYSPPLNTEPVLLVRVADDPSKPVTVWINGKPHTATYRTIQGGFSAIQADERWDFGDQRQHTFIIKPLDGLGLFYPNNSIGPKEYFRCDPY